MALVRAAHEQPARLSPADLDPLQELVGDGAYDYALVVAGFHFINRMADLLGLKAEVLPPSARRWEQLRRVSVRIGGLVMRRMDLTARPYPHSFEDARLRWGPVLERSWGRPVGEELAPLRPQPKLVEFLALALTERDELTSLDRDLVARVHRAVEQALPAGRQDMEGFHPRPEDPVEAFAFVGTRYAARCTRSMIDSLREIGFDDLGIFDLAIAVSDANLWARLHRLAGLDPELFYVPVSDSHRTGPEG